MLNSKVFITIAIFCSLFLFGIVNSSDAFEIEEMRPYMSSYEAYNYGGGAYHDVYVKTDEPYYTIGFWVDGHYMGSISGDNVKTEAYFNCNVRKGHIKGEKSVISALAWSLADDNGNNHTSDTDAYTIRVYKPIYLHRTGTKTGAIGYAEISRFYYDGSYVVMDSFAYARNPTDNPKAKDPKENPLEVAPWLRTNEYDGPEGDHIHPERRDTKPPEIIKVGEASQYFYPGAFDDEGREFNRFIGTLREGDNLEYYFGAHTHLQVSTTIGTLARDDWEVDTQQQTNTTAVTFTWKDGP